MYMIVIIINILFVVIRSLKSKLAKNRYSPARTFRGKLC